MVSGRGASGTQGFPEPTFLQVLPPGQVQLEARKTESTQTILLGPRAGREKQRMEKNQHMTLTVNFIKSIYLKSIYLKSKLYLKLSAPLHLKTVYLISHSSSNLFHLMSLFGKHFPFHSLLVSRPPFLSVSPKTDCHAPLQWATSSGPLLQ